MAEELIVFYDGICNFCDDTVKFIIKRDSGRQFRYAGLQSDFAKEKLASLNYQGDDLKSILLLEKGKIYSKSTAVLRIARKLKGLWPIAYIFIILPSFIRNFFYTVFARNRYKWFGQKDYCELPSVEDRSLFLDT